MLVLVLWVEWKSVKVQEVMGSIAGQGNEGPLHPIFALTANGSHVRKEMRGRTQGDPCGPVQYSHRFAVEAVQGSKGKFGCRYKQTDRHRECVRWFLSNSWTPAWRY